MSGRGRHAPRALIALCALVPVLAGCGGPGERGDQVKGVARTFERALDGDDRAALCAALAPETRSKVEDSEKKPCLDAIDAQDLPAGGPVRSVDVYGRQARAVLRSDTLFLSRFQDGWKIVAAGCVPRSGRPYQCSVEGG
ncbi:hypothetical protein ABZY45_25205 [Streptomyces sp. NPDC006516]|uniref:hypothetical protein n=1 Tax=Streptomyces sp. NPDC006516 TaxID=3154309 RepID=UPI0033B8816B